MFTAELEHAIDRPWLSMAPIRVDPRSNGRGSPSAYLTIYRDGEPFARADIFPYSDGPFTHIAQWRRFIVAGLGDYFHLIDPEARIVHSVQCNWYFGSVKAQGNRLLVATSIGMFCLDALGEMLWRNDNLGIDGVIIDNVHDGIIEGQGEWDPPGGWRPFRLSLATGEVVDS